MKRQLYNFKMSDGTYASAYSYSDNVENTCRAVARNRFNKNLWYPIDIKKIESRSTNTTLRKPAKKAETKTNADKNSQLPGQLSFDI